METDRIIVNEREEIQALLGKNPGYWVRNGIPILFGLFIVLLGLGWMINYPDVIVAPVTLTSENPPVRVYARVAGKINALQVRENDVVQAGQLLAELESGANAKDVDALRQFLVDIDDFRRPDQFDRLQPPRHLQLGRMQTTFAALVNAVQLLQLQLGQDIVARQIVSIDHEIAETRQLIESLQRQADILREDFALMEKDFERQEKMYRQDLSSSREFEKVNSAYLRQKQQLEGFNSNISTHRIKIRQLETLQSQLSQQHSGEIISKLEEVRKIARNMRGELGQWELEYLVKAPVDGRLSFSIPLTGQQYVRPDQELFSIVSPRVGDQAFALATLPQKNFGKVEVNQAVKIRLDGFPYQEYGTIEGRVSMITAVPGSSGYAVHIALPPELRTSMHKLIPYKPEASGIGQIITQKRNLLQRIFQLILSLRE